MNVVYRPVGIGLGLAGGMLGAQITKQVWKRFAGEGDPPGPLESEYGWGEILLAGALSGAISGVIRAAVDRAGAQAFERATGEWPGD
ncbi:unannotated protein [freshwater metagenome]|uniref:Unannotated protein n=1 Tax=freshwater metagenome TaxID=449393 RepID=A0A6J7HQL9_9ZZZZ|nr:DUF4235 domain-containing protein [Actinomycetota bacterium]